MPPTTPPFPKPLHLHREKNQPEIIIRRFPGGTWKGTWYTDDLNQLPFNGHQANPGNKEEGRPWAPASGMAS